MSWSCLNCRLLITDGQFCSENCERAFFMACRDLRIDGDWLDREKERRDVISTESVIDSPNVQGRPTRQGVDSLSDNDSPSDTHSQIKKEIDEDWDIDDAIREEDYAKTVFSEQEDKNANK